jgi:hypothetical protein
MAHRTLILAAVFLAAAAPASAQAPQPAWYVDGPVSALLVEGETLYVGGTFSAAGSAAGPLALADSDGRVVRTHPGFSGGEALEVRALAADGAGGWFAGGTFERVDGWERGGLVHLLANGSVDPDFHVEIAGTVEALILDGSTLWVGGTSLTALDAATGARLEQQPPALAVDALAVAGDRLFVAGPSGLTALDGATVAWQRAGAVTDVDVRDGVVYAAGPAGAVARRASDGSEFVRYTIDEPHAIAAGDGVVVVRGRRLAAFDATTGADRGWFGDVYGIGEGEAGDGVAGASGADDAGGALAIDGTRLYVAGDAFASFDLRDGSRVPWSPPLLGGTVRALEAAEGVVAIGGAPSALDGGAREHVAAFDLRTGAVKAFAPRLDGPVAALHRVGGVLYAGGEGGLAALDAQTGARLPFPHASSPVLALAASGDTLYVGGAPGTLGGTPTSGLGAVSLSTGTVLPFAPALPCDVDALAVSGATLHAGGCFGLRSYRNLAPTSGPAVDGRVLALREDGASGLWAGGSFAGGNVAHFAADGTPLVDSPVTDGPVHALALDDGTVHLGGRFTRIQDAPRVNVGRVALIGGSVGAFNPRPNDTVAALAPLPGGGLAVGGAFGSTWEATTGGLAVFGDRPSFKVRPPSRRPGTKGVPPERRETQPQVVQIDARARKREKRPF